MKNNELRQQDIKLPKVFRPIQSKKTVKEILSIIKCKKQQIKREMHGGQSQEQLRIRNQSSLLQNSFAQYNKKEDRNLYLPRRMERGSQAASSKQTSNRKLQLQSVLNKQSSQKFLEKHLILQPKLSKRVKAKVKDEAELNVQGNEGQQEWMKMKINKLPTIINLSSAKSSKKLRHKSYQTSQQRSRNNMFSVPQTNVRKESQRNHSNISYNINKLTVVMSGKDLSIKDASQLSQQKIALKRKKSISDSYHFSHKKQQKINHIAIKEQLKQILYELPKDPKKRLEQTLQKLVKFLRVNNPFFSKINEVIAICLLKVNKFIEIPKNHIIYRERDTLQSMFLIIYGKVRLSSKENQMKRICHMGESIGEQSFFSNSINKYSLQKAVSCSSVYLMEINLQQYKKMTEQMMKYGYKVAFTEMEALLRRNFIIKNWKRGSRQRCHTKY